MSPPRTMIYGEGDATYQALGGFSGIARLVDDFYRIMDSHPAFRTISEMHADDDVLKREKLTYFLCGWSGGAESYRTHFGKPIALPSAHGHLKIGVDERDQWLSCMVQALECQDYPDELKKYLLWALSHPAERIRMVSEKMQPHRTD